MAVSNLNGVGNYTYQWQKSPNGTDSWTDVGTNSNTYNAPIDEAGHTYYRVNITDNGRTSGCNTLTKNTDVNVWPQFNAGTLSGSETICYNGDPAEITPSAATGGDGTYVYQWQSKTTGSYTDIDGATSASYNPPSGLTATTTYQRLVKDEVCQDEWVSSGEWTVTVSVPSVDGIADGDMVWSGNAGTTDWSTAGNWLLFNASQYSVAGSAPTADNNVFLVTYGDGCSVGNPVLGGSSATKTLTIG